MPYYIYSFFSGGINDGAIVGIVIAVFILVAASITIFALRDKWLPLITSRDPEARGFVDDDVEMDTVQSGESYPDYDQQPFWKI